jgi:predicted  nucleic acid-binding Zn-ribbon protein
MTDMLAKTVARLEEWEHQLALALERTHIEAERQRIQRQLADLSTARDQLEHLSDEQLEQVYERLCRSPNDWIAHRQAS